MTEKKICVTNVRDKSPFVKCNVVKLIFDLTKIMFLKLIYCLIYIFSLCTGLKMTTSRPIRFMSSLL